MKTKFTNLTSITLSDPFKSIKPYSGDLPSYMKNLTSVLCTYHPSIVTELNVKLNGDNINVEVTMKN